MGTDYHMTILLYADKLATGEMLTGPISGGKEITEAFVTYPLYMTPDACALISGLLRSNSSKRFTMTDELVSENDLKRSLLYIFNFEICEILGPTWPILVDCGTLLVDFSPP